MSIACMPLMPNVDYYHAKANGWTLEKCSVCGKLCWESTHLKDLKTKCTSVTIMCAECASKMNSNKLSNDGE